ncbi:alpha/beta fold hydrolase [Rhodococcus sp. 311R]|uniref:alpha/beta fold hydrolase n=1 Tax=Rhodococcus sp. 311R TaxID=1617904 RepID=UPI0009E5CF76|nr:alpha/beta hydrolase [Rhodococcus sp. 311R]
MAASDLLRSGRLNTQLRTAESGERDTVELDKTESNEERENHCQGNSELVRTRDGRYLHAMVLPGSREQAVTVIFEAGAAASRSGWALVQPAVGQWARAVAYDRSGLGRSAIDPQPRTLRRMADDLSDVLDHFGPGPFVLVGHSAGGPIVRAAAASRPERITGLVLVDPTDEAADLLFGRMFRLMERVAIAANMVLARTKLMPRLYKSMTDVLPEDARRDMAREGFTVTMVRTHASQADTFIDDLYRFRADPPALGKIPVTVISGARTGSGMNATVRAAANASHQYRAEQSADGRHVIAERSGHYVPITDPAIIVEEIRRLVDRVKDS